jgi:hypothetical protein
VPCTVPVQPCPVGVTAHHSLPLVCPLYASLPWAFLPWHHYKHHCPTQRAMYQGISVSRRHHCLGALHRASTTVPCRHHFPSQCAKHQGITVSCRHHCPSHCPIHQGITVPCRHHCPSQCAMHQGITVPCRHHCLSALHSASTTIQLAISVPPICIIALGVLSLGITTSITAQHSVPWCLAQCQYNRVL